MKTVLEIITMFWLKAGNKGLPTREFVSAWLKAHPHYAGFPLNTRFAPGVSVGGKPLTRLDRATRAWIAAGNPKPSAPDFDRDAFEQYLTDFRDEYDALEPARRLAPNGPAAPK